MTLHGAKGLQVGDIDILMDPDDARRILAAQNTAPLPAGTSRFRSEVYGAWTSGSYRIEVMANFAVFSEERWVAVQPTSRVAMELPTGPVFIPSMADLIKMCRLFGRPKDTIRERLMQALVSAG